LFSSLILLLSLPFTADGTSFPGDSHLALVFTTLISSSLQVLCPSLLL